MSHWLICISAPLGWIKVKFHGIYSNCCINISKGFDSIVSKFHDNLKTLKKIIKKNKKNYIFHVFSNFVLVELKPKNYFDRKKFGKIEEQKDYIWKSHEASILRFSIFSWYSNFFHICLIYAILTRWIKVNLSRFHTKIIILTKETWKWVCFSSVYFHCICKYHNFLTDIFHSFLD